MKKNAQAMHTINLNGNKISDDGIQHLARAICETSVQ